MNVIDRKTRKIPVGTIVGWLLIVAGIWFCINNIEVFVPIFKIVGLVVVNALLFMIFWKIYNKRVISKNKISSDVSKRELMDYFDINSKTVEKLQTRKVIVVHHLGIVKTPKPDSHTA